MFKVITKNLKTGSISYFGEVKHLSLYKALNYIDTTCPKMIYADEPGFIGPGLSRPTEQFLVTQEDWIDIFGKYLDNTPMGTGSWMLLLTLFHEWDDITPHTNEYKIYL